LQPPNQRQVKKNTDSFSSDELSYDTVALMVRAQRNKVLFIKEEKMFVLCSLKNKFLLLFSSVLVYVA
jgi:hypothetical protein